MIRLFSFVILALTANPLESSAQVSDDVISRAQRETLGDRRASLFYANELDRGVWTLTSIFSQPFEQPLTIAPTTSPRWVARRQTGRLEEPSGETLWADSRSCPALHGALWSLERLTLPGFGIPGITPPRPNAGVVPVLLPSHGPVVTVWGVGSQVDGAPMDLRVKAVAGPLVAWFNRAEADLSSCWTTTQPTL